LLQNDDCFCFALFFFFFSIIINSTHSLTFSS
jgi:hypothetical protein